MTTAFDSIDSRWNETCTDRGEELYAIYLKELLGCQSDLSSASETEITSASKW